jgi:hypothetical protein
MINDDIKVAIEGATKLNTVTVDWDSTVQDPPTEKVIINTINTINNVPDKVLAASTVKISANTSGELLLTITIR